MKEWMIGLFAIVIVLIGLAGLVSYERVEFSDIPSGRNLITGHFIKSAAKEYGGAIKGVLPAYARGFPGGRAIEVPKFDCYVCVCPNMEYGVSASDLEGVQKVCTERCGGTAYLRHAGGCSEGELTPKSA
jgi:hypothetical protein